MIKPEKTINGTKWIETIQINAEERQPSKISMASMKILLSTSLIMMKVLIMFMISMRTTNYSSFWRRMPSTKMPWDTLPSHLACCSIRAFYSRLIKATYLKSTRHFTRHWIIPRLRASMHLFWKHCLQLLTTLSQFLAPLPRNATIWIKCWTRRRRTVTWFHFHIFNRR